MSCSGGEAALIADMALEQKVTLSRPLTRAPRPKVAATLNEYVAIDNPLDYHTFIWNQVDKLDRHLSPPCLRGGFDAGVLILDVSDQSGNAGPPLGSSPQRRYANAAKIDQGARAVVTASLPECMPPDLAADLAAQRRCPDDGP